MTNEDDGGTTLRGTWKDAATTDEDIEEITHPQRIIAKFKAELEILRARLEVLEEENEALRREVKRDQGVRLPTGRPRMSELHINLKAAVSESPEFLGDHIKALGAGWLLASEMTGLHGTALQRIARDAGQRPTLNDVALINLGTHGLNLFLATMSLIVRGQFDVSPYLYRAAMDVHSVAVVAGVNEKLAKRFFEGNLDGGKARQEVTELLKADAPDKWEHIDSMMRQEAEAANNMAHVKPLHLSKLLASSGDAVIPNIDGHFQPEEAVGQAHAAIANEYYMLSRFKIFKANVVGQEWVQRFETLMPRILAWYDQTKEKP